MKTAIPDHAITPRNNTHHLTESAKEHYIDQKNKISFSTKQKV
jgi:hypothetical protein